MTDAQLLRVPLLMLKLLTFPLQRQTAGVPRWAALHVAKLTWRVTFTEPPHESDN